MGNAQVWRWVGRGSMASFVIGGMLAVVSTDLWPCGVVIVGLSVVARVAAAVMSRPRGQRWPRALQSTLASSQGREVPGEPEDPPGVEEEAGRDSPVRHIDKLVEQHKKVENLVGVRQQAAEVLKLVDELTRDGRIDRPDSKMLFALGYRYLDSLSTSLDGIKKLANGEPVEVRRLSHWDPLSLLLLEHAREGDTVYISSCVKPEDLWPTFDGHAYEEAMSRAAKRDVLVRHVFFTGDGFSAHPELADLVTRLRESGVQVRFASADQVDAELRRDAVAVFRPNGRNGRELVVYLRMYICWRGFATNLWFPPKEKLEEYADRLPRLWAEATVRPVG